MFNGDSQTVHYGNDGQLNYRKQKSDIKNNLETL